MHSLPCSQAHMLSCRHNPMLHTCFYMRAYSSAHAYTHLHTCSWMLTHIYIHSHMLTGMLLNSYAHTHTHSIIGPLQPSYFIHVWVWPSLQECLVSFKGLSLCCVCQSSVSYERLILASAVLESLGWQMCSCPVLSTYFYSSLLSMTFSCGRDPILAYSCGSLDTL